MLRMLLRAKLHRLRVTERNIEYEGSLTVDRTLLDRANIVEGEKVQVVNVNNGARFETYVIAGKPDSGVACLNGAAARLAEVGDVIIVIAYAFVDENEVKKFRPTVVLVDPANKVKKVS